MEEIRFNNEILTSLDNGVTYIDSNGVEYIRTGLYTLVDKKEYKTHIIGQKLKKEKK